MNIRDISKPVTAKALNESLARRFGQRINLEAFTLDRLQDSRNNLRTKMSQVETTESFNSVQKETYQKTKLFLDVLNAEIAEREQIVGSKLKEGAEDKAELTMAAKDMVDRVTGWMEDTAEMETESMLALADSIRDEMGSEESEQFTNTVRPALEALYQVMAQTRETLIQGVSMITGDGGFKQPMGDDPMDDDPMDSDPMDDDPMDSDPMDDEFGADASAAGGELEGGREKRESVQRPRSKKK
jgi:hypothetical protein